MPDSDMKKMEQSDKTILGNRQLIVCGFKPKEQVLLKKIVKKCHVTVPILFTTDNDKDVILKELNERGASAEAPKSSLSRAVIAAGITEKEFLRILDRTKASTLDRPLWANLTETSQEWTLNYLLNELLRERAVMG